MKKKNTTAILLATVMMLALMCIFHSNGVAVSHPRSGYFISFGTKYTQKRDTKIIEDN